MSSRRFETAALLLGASEKAFPIKLPMDSTYGGKLLALIERELGTDSCGEHIGQGRNMKTGELLDLVRELDHRLRAEGEQGPLPSALFPGWRSEL